MRCCQILILFVIFFSETYYLAVLVNLSPAVQSRIWGPVSVEFPDPYERMHCNYISTDNVHGLANSHIPSHGSLMSGKKIIFILFVNTLFFLYFSSKFEECAIGYTYVYMLHKTGSIMLRLESFTAINRLFLWAAAGSLWTNACQLQALADDRSHSLLTTAYNFFHSRFVIPRIIVQFK